MVVRWEHTHQYIPHGHGRTFVSLRGDSSSVARQSSAQVRSRKASRPDVQTTATATLRLGSPDVRKRTSPRLSL